MHATLPEEEKCDAASMNRKKYLKMTNSSSYGSMRGNSQKKTAHTSKKNYVLHTYVHTTCTFTGYIRYGTIKGKSVDGTDTRDVAISRN